MPKSEEDEVMVFRGPAAKEFMGRMFGADHDEGDDDEGDDDDDDGLDEAERSVLSGLLAKKAGKATKKTVKKAPAKRGYFKA